MSHFVFAAFSQDPIVAEALRSLHTKRDALTSSYDPRRMRLNTNSVGVFVSNAGPFNQLGAAFGKSSVLEYKGFVVPPKLKKGGGCIIIKNRLCSGTFRETQDWVTDIDLELLAAFAYFAGQTPREEPEILHVPVPEPRYARTW